MMKWGELNLKTPPLEAGDKGRSRGNLYDKRKNSKGGVGHISESI